MIHPLRLSVIALIMLATSSTDIQAAEGVSAIKDDDRTGSVDLAALVFFKLFKHSQLAYGARWIHSDRERAVNLERGSQEFAGTWSLGVWLNGKPTYEGKLAGEPGGKMTSATTLQKGWNLLLFKSTFIQWQWQLSIQMTGQDGDDLSDLRYATKPPAADAR